MLPQSEEKGMRPASKDPDPFPSSGAKHTFGQSQGAGAGSQADRGPQRGQGVRARGRGAA